jgi:predicted secreted Zn-dependent protease
MGNIVKLIVGIALFFAFSGGNGWAREQTGAGAVIVNQAGNSVLDPLYNEKYEYYEVCGCSEKDVQCDLTLKAIKCSDGNKYDSVTNWRVKWDYGYSRASKTCSPESFRVTVDVIFRLPKWVREVNAPQQLVDKWDGYMKNLIVHENGHRDRALHAAAELTRMIAGLPPARTCSDLDREVNRVSRARLKKLIVEQEEYDAATSHGHAQGVKFP